MEVTNKMETFITLNTYKSRQNVEKVPSARGDY